ncbi:MAG TPA: hypothetical protein VLJ37_12210 [bacterium]|nr:hypothetical protein [bacterium]
MAIVPTGFLQSHLWLNRTSLSGALAERSLGVRTGLGLELFRSGLEAAGVQDERLSGWIDDYQNASSLFKIADWMARHPLESERALQRIPRGIFSPNSSQSPPPVAFLPIKEGKKEEGGPVVAAGGVFINPENRPGPRRLRENPHKVHLHGPEDGEESGTEMIRVGGVYREMRLMGEIGPQIARFRDRRRGLEDRLGALNDAREMLVTLDAESDDFFRGVMGLFELASHPSGPRETRDRLQVQAILVLQSVLSRVPEDPQRQAAFVHAYLKFKEAAHGGLFRSSQEKYGTPGRALAASTEQVGYSLARCEKHCSKAVQRCVEETGRELVQAGMWGNGGGFSPPWTFRKAMRNAKVGLAVGGALFVSGAFWAAISLLISTPLALGVLTFAALCLPAATLTGFLWRAPRRLRQKAVSFALPSGRSQVRRLERSERRLLRGGGRRS